MNPALRIQTHVKSLAQLLQEIEDGTIQIPAFQRDYVWQRDNIKELFDSIKRRYPIGSLLFWKPHERIGENKERIGPYCIPKSYKEPLYILDGYQRLSTLFGCLTNPNKTSLKLIETEWQSLFSLRYDLKKQEFLYPLSKNPEPYQLPLYLLMNSSDFRQYQRRELAVINDEGEINEYLERADEIARALLDYQIACVDINNASITQVVEIFTRVNSTGQAIDLDWMANAFSYRPDFVLHKEIDQLIDQLEPYDFHEIDRNALFRCIQSSFGKLYIDEDDVGKMALRRDFPDVVKQTLPKILEAVKFLYEELFVLDAKLLPYNLQLIFVMDFFKAFDYPSPEQKEQLKKWFWITTYANYFTIYSLADQRKAYHHFKGFLEGKYSDPVYKDKPDRKFDVADFPKSINMKSVRSKALLLFMLHHSYGLQLMDAEEIVGYQLTKIVAEKSESQNFVAFLKTRPIAKDEPSVQGIDDRPSPANFTRRRIPLKMLKKKVVSALDLIDASPETYQRYLIPNNINELATDDDKLSARRTALQTAESLFTENLGLNYNWQETPF